MISRGAAIVVFTVLNESDRFASRTAGGIVGPLSASKIRGLEFDEFSSNRFFRHDRQAKQKLSWICVFQVGAVYAPKTLDVVRHGTSAMP